MSNNITPWLADHILHMQENLLVALANLHHLYILLSETEMQKLGGVICINYLNVIQPWS